MRWRGGRGEITQSDEKGDHRAHPAMPMRLRSRQRGLLLLLEKKVACKKVCDGMDERAKPQLGNIFGASYVTEMYGSNDKKDGN